MGRGKEFNYMCTAIGNAVLFEGNTVVYLTMNTEETIEKFKKVFDSVDLYKQEVDKIVGNEIKFKNGSTIRITEIRND